MKDYKFVKYTKRMLSSLILKYSLLNCLCLQVCIKTLGSIRWFDL